MRLHVHDPAADRAGVQIGVTQDTPIASARAENHVVFNQKCNLQTPLEQLTEGATLHLQVASIAAVLLQSTSAAVGSSVPRGVASGFIATLPRCLRVCVCVRVCACVQPALPFS